MFMFKSKKDRGILGEGHLLRGEGEGVGRRIWGGDDPEEGSEQD